MQAALVRPKGKLAYASKAVLRVTASRPCAPASSRWPTAGGVWAFWDGIGPKLARAVVNHAVTFYVFDFVCALPIWT